MVTGEWVAIHRKHHATTDVEGDPHSPVVLGIKKVFWQGAELYRQASDDVEMVKKYSHGTPDDWIEENLYSKALSFACKDSRLFSILKSLFLLVISYHLSILV